jgi:hypothetical protein
MPLRLDNARALPTCPQQKQQTKKTLEPRFKIDHAASPMPETDSQNASRPGRHQIGMVGEIISESRARSNRYTRARSSESAPSRRSARSLLRSARRRSGDGHASKRAAQHGKQDHPAVCIRTNFPLNGRLLALIGLGDTKRDANACSNFLQSFGMTFWSKRINSGNWLLMRPKA